jgi:coenzyme F420 biosynthesis associated uncharacterized protein
VSLSNRELRRLGLYLALGVIAGTGVRYYIESRARASRARTDQQQLIDWQQARKVALRVSQWEQAPLENRVHRQEQYMRLVKRSEPLIADYLGVDLPEPISRVYVVDRREWLEANFTSFEQLFKPIEDMYEHNKVGRTALAVLLGDFNGRMLGAQIGMLLGFLGKRVLGQYDLSLLSPEPDGGGALYYVEPNIARIQTRLGLNDEDFRLWIALHETTHAFEFEAYPWVRNHFNGLLQQYFDQLNTQLNNLTRGLPNVLTRIVQNIGSDRHWIELVLTPEQHHIFEQLQALMSLVEGYSNHIMNAIGSQLLPSFHIIEQRMEQRQKSRTLLEQLFYRLTGMDLKMAQYQQGEAFVNEVVRQRGIAFASQVWERAENLPTLDEIRHPHKWMQRMDHVVVSG